MPPESPRILELRRRVQSDPASIAFAQLAEEYRRAGSFDEAIKCCRTGLARHPGYLSARVTLGRALIEYGSLDEAAGEFDLVLRSAPDNLAAIRGMAEIHQRRGHLQQALDFYRHALTLARHDPELEETVTQIGRDLGTVAKPSQSAGLSFEEAHSELLSAFTRFSTFAPMASPGATADTPVVAPVESAGTSDESSSVCAPAPSDAPDPPAHRTPIAPDAPVAPVPLTDFDALLRNLGVPDASPPPVMEMLLTKPPAVSTRSEPALADLASGPFPGTDSQLSDPFAELERELRAFTDRPSARAADDGGAETYALQESDGRTEAHGILESDGGGQAGALQQSDHVIGDFPKSGDTNVEARNRDVEIVQELEDWLAALRAHRVARSSPVAG